MQDLKIDKSNWEKVTLADIVFEPKEVVKDIAAKGFKHIVGLEHMDSDDIHLRRSFSGEADTTFTKVFRKGDVLFGRRRAYLKKAVQANFDGVCSGDITVLRANKNIKESLLPFIIHNKFFFDYAIKHSAGGLSPRVKFKDLAKYEFLLPPRAQQEELAELLWAMDELIEKDLEVLKKLENYSSEYIENFFTDRNQELTKVKLKDIADINKYSLTNKTNDNYEFSYIDLSSIQPRKLLKTEKITYKNSPSRARRVVKDGSILISTVRPYQLCNVYIETNDCNYVASTGTAVINLNNDIDAKLVFEQFFKKRYVKFIEDRMTGTNYPAITGKDLEDFEVFIPKDKNSSTNFSIFSNNINRSKSLIRSKLESSKVLQETLINQLF
ncbi:restriction endonuclease subunit S [Mucilaginibacter roseus]|uniref:Restriction endonuclease subunit S n=1 Tax=Mucilaginibacter roseus TaxID=1528868 RepID=A0ABS8TWT1_9SPHI|nr:restriction endonuclease subunit S [Mucilaginibacter roseus]MCD8739324.1 restriction endonuclease subunit S [Mucilaginibacter roseus]